MKKAWRDWLDRFYALLREDGLSIDRDRFAAACDGFFSRDIAETTGDGYTNFERRIAGQCGKIGIEPPKKRIQYIASTIANAWQEQVCLDPEAVPTLEKLQSHSTLALISNFDHPPHIYAVLEKLGLDKYFDTVIISGEAGVGKPDPRIFDLALEKNGLEPGRVVYVGDTDDDICGARAAGIRPILIRRDGDGNNAAAMDFKTEYGEDEADHVGGDDVIIISSLSELIYMV